MIQFPYLLRGPVLAASVSVVMACQTTALADATTLPEVAVDPYADVVWNTVRQAKSNLHTHSTQSDGSLTVPAVIDGYHALGYEVLAMTDHDRVTWPWTNFGRDPQALGMVAVQGNELSRHHHVNSLFCGYTATANNLETSLAGVAAAQGIVLLNHPAMHWPSSHPPTGAEVRVPMSPTLRALAQGDFTVETWFRTTKAGRNILLGNFSTSYSGALNLELHTENRARVYFQPVSGAITDLNVSATTLGIDTRDGQWHHLAAVRAGTALRLFLNGQLLGEAAAAQPGFDLQGDHYFLGRDTRSGSTRLVGALDQSRLWTRALSAAEIASLAAGAAIPDLQQGSTGLLAEYRFETSDGTPVAPAPSFDGTIDDSAGHPQGPFHGVASGGETLAVTDQVPAPLLAADQSRHALGFDVVSGVPASALAYYRDLFERHPAMFGMEVLNGTRPLGEYTLDRQLWDGLLGELMPQRPVWGMATDDMHSTTHLGRDWAMLLIDSLDEAAVRDCLESGRYYFSSTRVKPAGSSSTDPPPRIDSIIHDTAAGRITINASVNGTPLPADSYSWISHGQVVHGGPVIEYRGEGLLPANARYLRAEIQGEGGITLTNPIGFAIPEEPVRLENGASLKISEGTEAGTREITMHEGNLWLGEAVEVGNEIVLIGPAAGNVIGGTLPLDYLVVGGGGGGAGRDSSGGGGGGGVVSNLITPGLRAAAGAPGESIEVSVGDGGDGGGVSSAGGTTGQGANGEPSSFDSVTASGGGGGGSYNTTGKSGASGGGGGRQFPGGSGTADQGNDGGTGSLGTTTTHSGGGGGGAATAGSTGIVNAGGGNGGDGLAVSVTGTSAVFAGGGGGTPHRTQPTFTSGTGGLGGGGNGATSNSQPPQAGTAHTGGGGGASRSDNATFGIGGKGGSGIVIVRYPGEPVATGGSISPGTGDAAGSTIHTFTDLGAGALSFGSFTGTASATLTGAISGSGGFTWNSTGSLTLAQANSYIGDTVVNGGTLVLQQATLADGSSVFLNGGATLDLAHGQTDTVAELWIDGVSQAPGTYDSANTGGAITGTGALEVTGTTGGFAWWIEGFYPGETDPVIVGPNADPNGDGVANALVYLFGGDPKDGDNLALLPTATAATNPGGTVPNGDYLVFSYRRDTTAQVTATVEHSTTLAAPWTTATDGVDGVVVVETADGFSPGIDEIDVFIPRSASRMFGRVAVTLP